MKKSDVLLALDKLDRAYKTLKEAVDITENNLERDGTIKRFEFTFELLWKTLKINLDYYGVDCNSPKVCIKEAFRNKLIDDGEIFLDMLEDRNKTTHIYDDKTVGEIFERIKIIYVKSIEKFISKNRSAL